ncbi:MAG: hypothetical protein LBL87_06585 [Ruminococcus sp.]|jgi:hypothetical protein|nr:hypothetical protein [Ruminococcus sp.]
MAKFKKFSLKIDRKYSLIPFFITLAAAIGARFYQLFYMTDLNTGIYRNRSLLFDYPVLIIAVGLIITLLFLIFGTSEDKVIKSVIMINPMHQPLSSLMHNYGGVAGGVALGAGALIGAQFAMVIGTARNRSLELITAGAVDVPYLTGLGADDAVSLFMMAFSLLALLITSINIFNGNGITPGNCFFMLAIPVWKIVECFGIIYDMQKEARILILYSEKLYIIIADMCIAMFFFRLVRVFASMEDGHARLKLIFWGYVTTIITLVSAIPRFIIMFAVAFDLRESVNLPDLSDIGFAAFAICVIPAFFSNFSYREMPKVTYTQRNAQAALMEVPVEKQQMDEMDFNNVDTSELNNK